MGGSNAARVGEEEVIHEKQTYSNQDEEEDAEWQSETSEKW